MPRYDFGPINRAITAVEQRMERVRQGKEEPFDVLEALKAELAVDRRER